MTGFLKEMRQKWVECLRQCNMQYNRVFPQRWCYSWIKYNCSLCQESMWMTWIITLISFLLHNKQKIITDILINHNYCQLRIHVRGVICFDWIASTGCPQHTEYFPISGTRYCMDYMSSKNILNGCHKSTPHWGFTVQLDAEKEEHLCNLV